MFEQILADGMNLPHSLKNLFSVEKCTGSYPVTELDDSHIPGISALYVTNSDSHEHGGDQDHDHTIGSHSHRKESLPIFTAGLIIISTEKAVLSTI